MAPRQTIKVGYSDSHYPQDKVPILFSMDIEVQADRYEDMLEISRMDSEENATTVSEGTAKYMALGYSEHTARILAALE